MAQLSSQTQTPGHHAELCGWSGSCCCSGFRGEMAWLNGFPFSAIPGHVLCLVKLGKLFISSQENGIHLLNY